MKCDQCEATMINGIFCHEIGCPNSHKKYVDGEWMEVYTCPECGFESVCIEDVERCCKEGGVEDD